MLWSSTTFLFYIQVKEKFNFLTSFIQKTKEVWFDLCRAWKTIVFCYNSVLFIIFILSVLLINYISLHLGYLVWGYFLVRSVTNKSIFSIHQRLIKQKQTNTVNWKKEDAVIKAILWRFKLFFSLTFFFQIRNSFIYAG